MYCIVYTVCDDAYGQNSPPRSLLWTTQEQIACETDIDSAPEYAVHVVYMTAEMF